MSDELKPCPSGDRILSDVQRRKQMSEYVEGYIFDPSMTDEQEMHEYYTKQMFRDMGERIVQECVNGEKIVSVSKLRTKELLEPMQVERSVRCKISDLVRCNKCKHWETVYETDKAETGLCYGFKFSTFVTPRNGFCFKGERRSE